MPEVPNLPGVPTLSSYSANDVVLLLADVVDAIIGALVPQWGIFLDGIPVITYDNQVSFSYSQDWKSPPILSSKDHSRLTIRCKNHRKFDVGFQLALR